MSVGAVLRMRARRTVWRYPVLFEPLYRALARAPHLAIGRETRLVVEGFPRSGNSVFVTALVHAGVSPNAIAHHTHAAAQAIAGVRRGLPVCVLLRAPEGAIRSLAVRHGAPVREIARDWLSFHAGVETVRHGVLLLPFETAVGDPAAGIAALNRRFGLGLAVPEDGAAWRASVAADVAALEADPLRVSVPDAARETAKAAVDLGGCADLLARCRAVHARLHARAVQEMRALAAPAAR